MKMWRDENGICVGGAQSVCVAGREDWEKQVKFKPKSYLIILQNLNSLSFEY